MRRYCFMSGESLTCGLPEGGVEDYLKVRGFRQVKEVKSSVLKEEN